MIISPKVSSFKPTFNNSSLFKSDSNWQNITKVYKTRKILTFHTVGYLEEVLSTLRLYLDINYWFGDPRQSKLLILGWQSCYIF